MTLAERIEALRPAVEKVLENELGLFYATPESERESMAIAIAVNVLRVVMGGLEEYEREVEAARRDAGWESQGRDN